MLPSVPPAIAGHIEAHTREVIRGFSFSSGGCINHGGKLTTSGGVYFLKWNDREKFPGMFQAEARGLSLLRGAHALAVPHVVHVGEAEMFQYLLMEHITAAAKSGNFWQQFGQGLAVLHSLSADTFGLDHDNYIGSLPQKNTQQTKWVDFFIEQRLLLQLRVARNTGRVDGATSKKFEMLFNKLPAIIPDEAPALLHGDLWGGNLMTNAQGEPCLIDPAVYFGHPEADLAMTQLFGGFDPSFLQYYGEVHPLQPGYEKRLEIYNLYPLLVHVNLFGGAYARQVAAILDRVL